MDLAGCIACDVHSHVLPKMDDGSSSVDESLEMLRELWSQGVRAVVATPHFYPWNEDPDSFLNRRACSCALLAKAIREHSASDMPAVYIGAEVAFYRGLAVYPLLSAFCIKGTDHLLVEMPFENWSRLMIDEVISIKGVRAITPVIAHIERYLSYMDESMLDALINGGCIVQCNADSLLGFFSRKKIIDLMKAGKIQVIGSDCHNMHSRTPHMADASGVLATRLGDHIINTLNKNAYDTVSGAIDILNL